MPFENQVINFPLTTLFNLRRIYSVPCSVLIEFFRIYGGLSIWSWERKAIGCWSNMEALIKDIESSQFNPEMFPEFLLIGDTDLSEKEVELKFRIVESDGLIFIFKR